MKVRLSACADMGKESGGSSSVRAGVGFIGGTFALPKTRISIRGTCLRNVSYRELPLTKPNLLLFLLIALGLLGGLVSTSHRWQAETRNRRVELVVDYTDAQALANTTRRQVDDVLQQLKAAGITTVAITEDTLGTLNANGVVVYHRDGDKTVLTFAPGFPGQRARVIQMLAHKAPGLTVTPEGADGLRIGSPWRQFSTLPIGLDSDGVRTVQGNGLLVAPRLVNFTGVTAGSIAWEMAQTKR
ncbi:MAG: DUF5693 family protein, partial [Armatimonadota bacterium]|nr:DUF5693 family protein [Armatimonadota bacterium]